MNEERRQHLRTWYRQALARRADTLESLVAGIVEGRPDARDGVREIALALEGSGGTFGFTDVSEAARIVAGAGDDLLPRVVGLVDVLRSISAAERPARNPVGAWLPFAAGPLPDTSEGEAPSPDLGLAEGWAWVAARLALDPPAVAHRVASRLGIEVADPDSGERGVRLVVPPALALEYRVLPLRDDGARIVAASANPTDILAMAALERATGRTARLDVLDPGRLGHTLTEWYGRAGTDGPPDYGAPPVPLHDGATPGDASEAPTILVVDDEPAERLLCRTALERDGLKVLEAGGGGAALEILNGEARVDAVLVDVLMPDMDGRELLEAIRAHPVRSHLPVVVVTGLQSAENEVRLVEEGADDYVRKPVEPRVLVARIHACLRRRGTAEAP